MSFYRIEWSCIYSKIESPLNALCKVWLKLFQWLWRSFLNSFYVFLLFWYYLPLGKKQDPSFKKKFECQGCFIPNSVEIGPVVLENNVANVFYCYFVIISPLEKGLAFAWPNLNSLYQRMVCAKFDWKWSSGSGE